MTILRLNKLFAAQAFKLGSLYLFLVEKLRNACSPKTMRYNRPLITKD
jgi:hypothetical protein